MREKKGADIPFYQTARDLYTKNSEAEELHVASRLPCASSEQFEAAGLSPGQMYDKYLGSATNYASIMRIALATAVDMGVPNAKLAWQRYINSSGHADMAGNPTYAIVPLSPPGKPRPPSSLNVIGVPQ